MNRSIRSVVGVLGCAAVCAGVMVVGSSQALASARCTMVAMLTPQQEVPPVAGVGSFGAAQFEIDTGANLLHYRIVYTLLSSAETAAHIHGVSAPGANSGPVHTLPAGNVKVGTWAYPQASEAALLAGQFYVNVHSVNHPNGEIRGQIVTHVAEIDNGQEVPTPLGGGTGWGAFTIDRCANTLSYHIVIDTISHLETAAHIHGMAGYGQLGGVQHTLPLGTPKMGVWNYPENLEDQIMDGMLYVNVHTGLDGSGVMRGQIVPVVVALDGQQETPPLVSPGGGVALISIDRSINRLGYDIRSAGLTTAENNAHIHGYSLPGVASGVVHPLAAGGRKLGAWNYSQANEAQILSGLTYVNIHSVMHGAGEIRGQIEFPGGCAAPGDADGNEVVDFDDITSVLANWAVMYPAFPFTGPGDADGDGGVDFDDITAALANFGSCYQ